MLLEGLAIPTSPALILTSPELLLFSLDPALILPVSTFPVTLVTVMLPPEVVLELESRSRVLMSPLACRAIAPALILPVSTFPVSLVTVMVPPEVVLELELRSTVLMSPLAFRVIAPPWVVMFSLTARLLAA